MESMLAFGESALIVVIGLIVRLLIAVVGLAAICLPIVAFYAVWQWAGRLRDTARGLARVGTLTWRQDAAYAPWHTWLAPAGAGLARVGLDALAQRLLPRVTRIEMVAPGTALAEGDVVARVECGDRAAAVLAPAAGLVVATNDEVRHDPDLLRRDCYHRGWIALVAPAADEAPRLARGARARAWLAEEERRLHRAFEHELGLAVADGGELVGSPASIVPPDRWARLVQAFLGRGTTDEPGWTALPQDTGAETCH
jgi:glycine cleavage system H lipoate-binding protein